MVRETLALARSEGLAKMVRSQTSWENAGSAMALAGFALLVGLRAGGLGDGCALRC
jgi:hypothetical protein